DLTIIGSATVQTGATIQVADLVINNDDSSFNLNNEGTLIVTGDYDVDAAGDRFNWNDGGALEVQGALTLDDGLEGDSRTLSVSGSNASWVVSGPLAAGSNGVVYIENGAAVTNTTGVVLAGATNQVVIQDSGSQLISQGILTASGSTNRMTVQDGGLVVADGLNFSGDNFFYLKSDGTLSITNDFNWLATSNLSWQSGGILQVQGALTGMETATNTVNGTSNIVATVIDGGRDLTLNGGSLTVAADDLIVGYEDSNSNVRFTNGTAVVNRDGYIGWGSSSANNSVTVSGSGSVWHNTGGDLYIGAYWEDGTNLAATGSGNSLTVSDGGRVFVGEATNNVDGLLVASTNGATFTVWKGQGFIDDTLTIGLSSNVYGTVTITNGGDLSVGDLVINEDSLLELETGGTFRIATNFNQHYWEQNGFAWTSSNSTLQVGGELTRTNYYLDNGQDLILDGSNAVWTVAGQDLEIGRDGASVLTLSDGASLTNVNTYVGAAANTNNGSHGIYLLDGASWKSTGNLWIGSTSSNNFVEIYSQSQAEIDGSVYVGGESSGNYLLVSGSNSLMTIGGDLEIGNGSTNSTSNALELSNLARLHVTGDVVINAGNGILMSGSTTNRVGGDYTVRSNATVTGTGTVEFDDAFASLIFEDGNSFMQDDDLAVSDGIIFEGGGNNMLEVTGGTFFVDGSNSNQYRNFQTLELTDASIMGYGTNDAFSAVNISGGTIRPATYLSTNSVSAGTLVIDGATSLSDVTYEAQLLGVDGTDLLHFTDDVDIGDMLIAVYVANATNATNVVMTTDGTMSNTFKSNTVVNGMLLWDADVVKVGDEIQVVLTNNTEKFSSSLDYAGTESVRSGFSGMKNSVFTRTKQLRRNLVSTAHSMPHEAFLMTNTNSPSGPQGPGADNTIFDMHIWAQYFSGQGDYDAHGNSYGYTLNNSGTTLGADKLIGEALAVGFNYTYARGDARTSNDDYLDTETYWLGAYAEWVNRDGLFLDGLLAYGRSNYESVRVEKDDDLDYEGVADYRGDTFGAYLDVGQYMYYKNFSLAPYAGLHMLFITTEDHVETNESNDSGSRITVHGINRSIVESALGLKARHRFDTNLGRFQTTAFAEWTHDFVQDEIASTLEPDSVAGLRSAPVTMSAIKPEDDMFTIGLGLSWRNTEYMEIGVGYNGRYSDDYEEHTGSLMLDIMF
uniref:autotransporter domain-containing protein n=1 Tax=Pontiella sp. TaxID=2837462 RepID=UPI003566FDE1